MTKNIEILYWMREIDSQSNQLKKKVNEKTTNNSKNI
jgi:hypothetical protein